MLSTECFITARRGISKINTPIVLYRGDKNIEAKFQINNNPFTSDSSIKYVNNDRDNDMQQSCGVQIIQPLQSGNKSTGLGLLRNCFTCS